MPNSEGAEQKGYHLPAAKHDGLVQPCETLGSYQLSVDISWVASQTATIATCPVSQVVGKTHEAPGLGS